MLHTGTLGHAENQSATESVPSERKSSTKLLLQVLCDLKTGISCKLTVQCHPNVGTLLTDCQPNGPTSEDELPKQKESRQEKRESR